MEWDEMAGRQNLAETVEGLVNFYLMAYISDCRLTWPNFNTLEVTSINWQSRNSKHLFSLISLLCLPHLRRWQITIDDQSSKIYPVCRRNHLYIHSRMLWIGISVSFFCSTLQGLNRLVQLISHMCLKFFVTDVLCNHLNQYPLHPTLRILPQSCIAGPAVLVTKPQVTNTQKVMQVV